MPEHKEKEINYRNKFKKFGGERIPDVIEYIKEYIKQNPYVTISLGCDSVQRRRKTVYAITLMFYSISIKNGAHVIYFRDNITKVRDNFDRLSKEALYVIEIGEQINKELEGDYTRLDLSDIEQKRYKYHIAKCNGEFAHVDSSNQDRVIQNLTLTDEDKIRFGSNKLLDLHLDFNPYEGVVDKKGFAKNKSNQAYKAFVPGIRGMGYRVFAKPDSPAAASAADLLLKH
jgi:predicted RNase H-related nuclease YkuK (DUF458 family)